MRTLHFCASLVSTILHYGLEWVRAFLTLTSFTFYEILQRLCLERDEERGEWVSGLADSALDKES